LQTFTGHTHEVSSANFSPDGKQIISAAQCKYASPTVQTVLHVEMKIGIVLMSTDTSLRLARFQVQISAQMANKLFLLQ
jgi:WD40 repeat protein